MFVGCGPVLAYTHSMDRYSDSKYWQRRPVNAECPGPHFRSIWFKDHGRSVVRICVEIDSVMRLGNGDARARFVSVHYHGENSIVRGGKHFTSYISQYMALNCNTGLWNSDSGYHVQNKRTPSFLPVEGRPGWFQFTTAQKRSDRVKSLSTKFGSQLTRVSPKDRFLCPGL